MKSYLNKLPVPGHHRVSLSQNMSSSLRPEEEHQCIWTKRNVTNSSQKFLTWKSSLLTEPFWNWQWPLWSKCLIVNHCYEKAQCHIQVNRYVHKYIPYLGRCLMNLTVYMRCDHKLYQYKKRWSQSGMCPALTSVSTWYFLGKLEQTSHSWQYRCEVSCVPVHIHIHICILKPNCGLQHYLPT